MKPEFYFDRKNNLRNFYELLNEVFLNGIESPEKNHGLKSKPLVLLLQDPKIDHEFDHELGRCFRNWFLGSREKYFLTSLADPPASWIEWGNANQVLLNEEVSNSTDLYDPRQIYQTNDPSLTSLFIAEFIGIPFNKLPILLFCTGLDSREFFWMPTCKEDLDWQMRFLIKLGDVRENKEFFSLPNYPFKIKKIELKNKVYEVLIELSQIISSFKKDNGTIFGFSPKEYSVKINRQQGEKEIELNLFYSGINYLKHKAENLLTGKNSITDSVRFMIVRDESRSVLDEKLNSKMISFFEKRDRISRLIKTNFHELVSMNQVFLQKETILLLSQGMQMIELANREIIFDYSPWILPFVKSFEKELSYSIAHWVRKKYDIALPQYFYEFQPGKKAIVDLGRNFYVDFNQSRNDLWATPTLGGQISGFKTTAINSKEHPFKTEENYQQFLSLAYQLKNSRNRACHSEQTTEDDLDKVIKSWKMLLEGGFFETLYNLKKEYQGISN